MSRPPEWSDERLTQLAALPEDHPDVRAVREDPERWARLIALREFLHPSAVPPGARTEEAVDRIRSAVRAALRDEPVTAPAAGARRGGAVHGDRPPVGRGWWFGGWRSAIAAAAVLLVAGVLVYPRLTERSGALRGTADSRVQTFVPLIAGDQVEMRWRRVAGAERYEIQILRADLSPLRPAIATADSMIRLPAGEVFAAGAEHGTAFWRVVALRSGETIAQSDLQSIEAPRGR